VKIERKLNLPEKAGFRRIYDLLKQAILETIEDYSGSD
jgi:hypothetical protein